MYAVLMLCVVEAKTVLKKTNKLETLEVCVYAENKGVFHWQKIKQTNKL